MVRLRDLAQAVPGFGYAAKGRRRKISSAATVPDAFLEAIAVACEASVQLAAASELSASDLRSVITFARAFTSLANEMALVAKGLSDTIAEHRYTLGQRALRAYAIAKSINKPEERELLIPHLENLRRALGRVGRPRVAAKPEPPATPPTQPPPVPAPAPAAAPAATAITKTS